MIHQYKLGGYNIVLDVCSGAVHAVDDVAYDIISMFETNSRGKLLADDVSYAYIYRINGDKLILDFTENVVRDCEYTFSVDGAKLTLKGGTGTDGGTYSLNKK